MQRVSLQTPIVLGLDPGFANLGWALATWEDEKLRVLNLGAIHTKKANKKQHILECEDNFARAQELAQEIRRFFDNYRVVAVCAEAMSFPRQASVAAKMAMAWGVIADICHTTGTPMVQPTPQRVKKALCGRNSASKEEVQAAVIERFPWHRRVGGKTLAEIIEELSEKDREHAVDAVATIAASEDSEVLKLARRMAA